jgi:hypothetical protein
VIATDELEKLQHQGYCMDHLVPYFELTLGEPWLLNDTLFYFDGSVLVMCGYTLDRCYERDVLRNRLNSIRELIGYDRIRAINYYGPVSLCLPECCSDDMERTVFTEPDPINIDMQVELAEWKRTARIARDVSRGRRNGFEIRTSSLRVLTAGHIELIETFFLGRSDMDCVDREYAISLPAFVREPSTFTLTAFSGEKVVGLAVFSEWLQDTIVYVSGFYDRRYTGVSDCVMDSAFEIAKSKGVRRIDLGYSVHEGNYRYKMKWGANRRCEPFYEEISESKDGVRVRGYWFWRGRLLASGAK